MMKKLYKVELNSKGMPNFSTAQEVPQRTGRWIKHIDDLFPAESTLECNVCHHEQPITINDNYCPHCGARMEGNNESD